MLDILTIIHSFADIQTASRIRRTCRRLAVLIQQPALYNEPDPIIAYEYRVGSKLHRLDGPAKEYVAGDKSWFRGGIRHREYHPYYISENYRVYRVDGVNHREAGPSVLSEYMADWCLRDKLHRKVGPAYSYNGGWYTLDKLHRLDGPACEEIYAIRGVKHSISCTTNDSWIVDDKDIR